MSGTDELKPVFIGGTGRSGTTVLKRALARHPAVFALRDEFRVLVDPGGVLDLVGALSDRWSPYAADVAVRDFMGLLRDCDRSGAPVAVWAQKVEKNVFRWLGAAPRRYLGLAFRGYFGSRGVRDRVGDLVARTCHHVSRGSWAGTPLALRGRIYEAGPCERSRAETLLREFILDLLREAAGPEPTHWFEDTPTNLLHARDLLALFPEARLVHIRRDPRDVLSSYLAFSWGGDDAVAVARRLDGIYRRWAEVRAALPPGRWHEIALEDLAADGAERLAEICAFAGLEADPQVLAAPFERANVGRWRRDLDARTLRAVEPILAPWLEAGNYSAAGAPPSSRTSSR